MKIFAIDPAPTESAYVIWDGALVYGMGKVENARIVELLNVLNYDLCVIEKVASYGMAVGETVFETVFWSGRFAQVCVHTDRPFERIVRMDVKMNICKNPRARDSNITQALVDRFGGGAPNRGKGSKKEPGFFYGFKKDIWQAFALAVTFFDRGGVYET